MDGDAPLSPGNPHLLAAVRTFEIAMVPILHSIAPGDPKIPNRANRLKKFSVFGSASGQIPGQHTEAVSYTHLDVYKRQAHPGAKQRERLPGLQRGGRDMAEEDQAAADAGCAH